MSPSAGAYDSGAIEARWQRYWEEQQTFRTANPGEAGCDPGRPKFYVLDMFPYPSGVGLHVGHPLGYIATDVFARYKRMRGFNVLHPMGYDAFGLPAEQYAVEHGRAPADRHGAEHREHFAGSSAGWALVTTGVANWRRRTWATTNGPSGSSCGCTTVGMTGRGGRPARSAN